MSLPGFDDGRRVIGDADLHVATAARGRRSCSSTLPGDDPLLARGRAAAVVTGKEERQLAAAPEIWRRWAGDVTAVEVPGGHFVPEEAPAELLAALVDFLG